MAMKSSYTTPWDTILGEISGCPDLVQICGIALAIWGRRAAAFSHDARIRLLQRTNAVDSN